MSAEHSLAVNRRYLLPSQQDPLITNPRDREFLADSAIRSTDIAARTTQRLDTRTSRRNFVQGAVITLTALTGAAAFGVGEDLVNRHFTLPLPTPDTNNTPNTLQLLSTSGTTSVAAPTEVPHTAAPEQTTEKPVSSQIPFIPESLNLVMKENDLHNLWAAKDNPNESISMTMRYQVGEYGVDVTPQPSIRVTSGGIECQNGPYERDNRGITEYVFPALGFDTAWVSLSSITDTGIHTDEEKLSLKPAQVYPEMDFKQLEIFHVASAVPLRNGTLQMHDIYNIGQDFNAFDADIWRIFVTEKPFDATVAVRNSQTHNILIASADQFNQPGESLGQPGLISLTRDATNLIFNPALISPYDKISDDIKNLSRMYQEDQGFSSRFDTGAYVQPFLQILFASASVYTDRQVIKNYDEYEDPFHDADTYARKVLREFVG